MVETTKTLFLKKEVTYGTDAVPTGAANARYTRNFTAKPVVVDRIQRNLDRPVRGSSPDAASNKRGTFGYELEIAGSGAAGTAPAWMEDTEFCGMAAPVITAGTSAVQRFAPVGAALSSASAYHWHGTQKRVNLGVRGTYSFDFTAGSYPFLRFDMTGLLPPANSIVDAAAGAVSFDQWKDPVEINDENTDFTIAGYAARLRSLTGDVGATVALRALVGYRGINRGNHGITGRMVIEAPDIATRNFFQTLSDGSQVPVALDHGTVAGNIVGMTMAHVQLTDIELQEEDDVLMLACQYRANVGSVPDDLVWTAR